LGLTAPAEFFMASRSFATEAKGELAILQNCGAKIVF
jgi:hypothetical protein